MDVLLFEWVLREDAKTAEQRLYSDEKRPRDAHEANTVYVGSFDAVNLCEDQGSVKAASA